MKKFVLIVLFILISGCATNPPLYLVDSNSAYQSITCRNDRYLKTASCHLPSIDVFYGHDKGLYQLIWIKSGKLKEISLLFSFRLKDWIFFDSVYDINGNSLKVNVKNREVVNYGVIESIGVELKQEYLEKATVTGLNLAIYGKRGRKYLNIPAPYIAGFVKFLKEIQELEKQQKNKT